MNGPASIPNVISKLLSVLPYAARRALWGIATILGRILYPKSSKITSAVHLLPWKLVRKEGWYEDLIREADVLRLLARRTNLPVPRVVDVVRGERVKSSPYQEPAHRGFLIMTKLPGEPAGMVFSQGKVTEDQRKSLALELRAHLDEVRAIPPQFGDRICGFNGGPCIDHRDRVVFGVGGPFEDEAALNAHLVRRLPSLATDIPVVAQSFAVKHKICLAHNDLNRLNILIDFDRKGAPHISGILDWEASGWFPEYHDFVHGTYLEWDDTWRAFLETVFTEYELERAADNATVEYNY